MALGTRPHQCCGTSLEWENNSRSLRHELVTARTFQATSAPVSGQLLEGKVLIELQNSCVTFVFMLWE